MNKIILLKKYIVENKLFIGIIVLLFVGIYFMNRYYPIYIDDWSYFFMLGEDGRRVGSISDIFISQYNHYFEWGGRSVVHFVAQYLLYIGKGWSDMLNSVAYILFVITLYLIAKGQQTRDNIFLFVLINVFLWFFIPSLGENIFWKTGSANYLWGGLLVFSFLYPYCRYYYGKTSKNNTTTLISMFFFGLLAGWTNENIFIASLFFVVGISVLYRYQKKLIPRWAISGLIGLVIGGVVMLSAPGNFARNEVAIAEMGASEESPILFYFYRLTSIAKNFVEFAFWPSIIYLISFLVYLWKGREENKKSILLLSLLFFATSIVATIVMAAAPIFPHRVWFGIISFMLVATMILYVNLDFSFRLLAVIRTISFLFLLACFMCSYVLGISRLREFNYEVMQREQYIEKEKMKGVDNIVIYGKIEYDYSPFVRPYISDLPLDSANWMGSAYGRYMGVKTVTVVDTVSYK